MKYYIFFFERFIFSVTIVNYSKGVDTKDNTMFDNTMRVRIEFSLCGT